MAIDLSFTPDSALLREAARDFFARNCPRGVVRSIEDSGEGWDRAMWRAMADLGWLHITFPEVYGGAGGSLLDVMPLYEEMGRALVPCPHLDTVIVAGDVLVAAGSEA